jgi:hypothetical protein
MARQRQGHGGSRSLWARAGERVGNGAGALFAQLDAQDARDAQDALSAQDARGAQDARELQAREQGALTLERLAARIRGGVWNGDIAALVARAERLEAAER